MQLFLHCAQKYAYCQLLGGQVVTRKQRHELSRRERQVLDIIYRLGEATAATVGAELPDNPSYSAVRGMLRVLEAGGLLRHRQDGPRYVYMPTVSRTRATRDAVRHLLETFFDSSTDEAVAALLDMDDARLSREQRDRVLAILEKAREEGR